MGERSERMKSANVSLFSCMLLQTLESWRQLRILFQFLVLSTRFCSQLE
jgi:hypothetical protein